MSASFAERFASVRATVGPLVWGLDPSPALLEAWGFGDTVEGLESFVDVVLEAAVGNVGLVKPQSAYFERHGWQGVRSLARLVSGARSARLLVILDVKRGDIGSTNDGYALAYLGDSAPIAADALTVSPYLGLGAMSAFVGRATEAGAGLFVVTRSSNPEGRALQGALQADGRSVEEAILAEIGELNAKFAPGAVGPVGAVVAPTHLMPSLDLVGANGLFLAPGIGAQGATFADAATIFADCPERVLPSVSRSVLQAGPEMHALAATAGAAAAEARAALAGH